MAATSTQKLQEFNAKTPGADNILGTIDKRSCDYIELSCDELMTKKFNKQTKHDIGILCLRFDIINDELWLAQYDTSNIRILSLDRVKKHQLTFEAMGTVRALTRFQNKALISAQRGLFTVSTDQRHDVTKVFDGNFCDASVRGSLVYALTAAGSLHVVVIRHSDRDDSFAKLKDWQLVNHNSNVFKTIQATSYHVFVAQNASHVIQQYTMDGQLVTTHGRQGRNIGEMYYPFLTGSDEFNNILIAGNNNDRIDILKADGQFQSLPVAGVGPYPACARIYKKRLYVSTQSVERLQVFTIE